MLDVSECIKVTKEPELEQFCKDNYFIVDGNEDDNKTMGGLTEDNEMRMVTSLTMTSPQMRLMR